MTRIPTWFGVLMVGALAFSLTACKSGARRACANGNCAPPTMAAQPPVGDIDTPMVGEAYAPPSSPDGFPPAPQVPSDPAVTQADLEAAHQRADSEARARADAEAQMRAEQERLASAAQELENARARIKQLEEAPTGAIQEAPVAVQATTADQFVQDLRAQSNADVMRDGDLVIVRVTNSFQAGSDALRKDLDVRSTLNATATALSRYPAASVSVVGHSDTDPIRVTKHKWKDNDQLSLARAQRVASELARNGVDQNRISIDGRGAREPLIAPERSRSDKARNRRVEIMIRL